MNVALGEQLAIVFGCLLGIRVYLGASVMKKGVVVRVGLAAVLALSGAVAQANSGGGETFKEGVNYLPIKPALVVNYGGPGRVKYIKAEISLRVENAHSAQEVTHHMPLVRDTLIMLISSVTDEQMSSGDGKEKMRVEALAKLNQALEAAEHPPGAEGHDDKKAEHKDEHASEHKEKEPAKHDDKHGKEGEEAHGEEALISDLLFDNLVVQK